MSAGKDTLRTPLGKVRGLGAARHGSGHFLTQRISALALVPLTIWFVWAVASHAGASYTAAAAFLAHPVNAGLMLLFVLTGIYHFTIGLQVVIEDYTGGGTRLALILINKFAAAAIALACVLAILKLAV